MGNVATRSVLQCFVSTLQTDRLCKPHVSRPSSSPKVRPLDMSRASPIDFWAGPCSALPGYPPAPFTSQHLTVQSAPPLTSNDDSALNAIVYIAAVCPAIFLTRFPDPISQRFIARSSPANGVSVRMTMVGRWPPTCGGQIFSIWAHSQCGDCSLMPHEDSYTRAFLHIPKSRCPIT